MHLSDDDEDEDDDEEEEQYPSEDDEEEWSYLFRTEGSGCVLWYRQQYFLRHAPDLHGFLRIITPKSQGRPAS